MQVWDRRAQLVAIHFPLQLHFEAFFVFQNQKKKKRNETFFFKKMLKQPLTYYVILVQNYAQSAYEVYLN